MSLFNESFYEKWLPRVQTALLGFNVGLFVAMCLVRGINTPTSIASMACLCFAIGFQVNELINRRIINKWRRISDCWKVTAYTANQALDKMIKEREEAGK